MDVHPQKFQVLESDWTSQQPVAKYMEHMHTEVRNWCIVPKCIYLPVSQQFIVALES